MKHRLVFDTGRLARELASLPALDRDLLIEKWRTLYDSEPPTGVRNTFLMNAIAYRMQEHALGGVKPATRHFLEKAVEENSAKKEICTPLNIRSGTRLLREWHGMTYEVIIMDNGVQCNGKFYGSLSEVARAITGTRWSGPLFFGLKKQRVK
ncbi:MAG: DUF2924 domain-containing protein [Syntrophales bacterium]